MICVGFLASYLSGLVFAGSDGWRLMFALTAVPCVLLVALLPVQSILRRISTGVDVATNSLKS